MTKLAWLAGIGIVLAAGCGSVVADDQDADGIDGVEGSEGGADADADVPAEADAEAGADADADADDVEGPEAEDGEDLWDVVAE